MVMIQTTVAAFALLNAFAAAAPRPVDAFPHDGFIGEKKGIEASVPSAPASTPAPSTAAAAAGNDVSTTASTHQSGGSEYVVIFDADQDLPDEVDGILNRVDLSSNHSDVKYTFNNGAFKGFVASMKSHCINALNNMTEVSFIEQTLSISSLATRGQAPWGLQRVSSSGPMSGNDKDLAFTYTFDDTKLGAGVDIYVVDTGVNVNHAVFGGRATNGFSFQADQTDGDGHGTHVAGTAAGSVFGVASGANIIAVKVLGADGSGASSDTLVGMDWVIQNNNKRKTQPGYVGAVMSMSWGLSGTSQAIDTAVRSAVDSGIHVSLAAGNSGKDSCGFAPASTGGDNGPAVTVGSVGISGKISSFSNTGKCNDVYAPGENILSSWNTANNTINFLSGTSMACPHVTGVMAYLMVKNPALAKDPAAMKKFLKSNGIANLATGTALAGDEKVLVNNGVTSKKSKRGIEEGLWTVVEEGEVKRGVDEGTFVLKREEKAAVRY